MPEQRGSAPPQRKVFDNGFFVLLGISVVAGAALGLRDGWGRVAEILLSTGGFITELSPKILASVFVAAGLPLLLPQERVAAWIGAESGLRGLAIAAAAGAIIPGGPMMILPLAASFLAGGADLGATVAFITGWNLFSLNRTLIWELSFLPAHVVALRILLSLPFALLSGLAVRRLMAWRATRRET